MGARWISYLRKLELEAILKEFSLEATGSVEEMRGRSAAFNSREDQELKVIERLREWEAEINAAMSENKQRAPSPVPPGSTQLQVLPIEGISTPEIISAMEKNLAREYFPSENRDDRSYTGIPSPLFSISMSGPMPTKSTRKRCHKRYQDF
ncbi:uncharacterized protein [Drosophila suzukii]|uniref:Uncharacterized protein isoform X1 n=1 Tax=Drosophila suzukii TaxID=28584 RepID=A0ABM4TWQ8_DROSZ